MEQSGTNMEYMVLLAVVILVIVLIIIVAYYIGRSQKLDRQAKELKQFKKVQMNIKDEVYYQDKLSSSDEQIRRLNELNERYLTFTENLSDVVKRLYSSLSAKEISSAVVKLVRDIFETDMIEMYVYDPQERVLNKVSEFNADPGGKDVYTLGEGLIGSSAKDGIIKIKGVTYPETNLKNYGQDSSKFWMVSPIHFNNRLIGVLGIGKVKNPTGNERNLVKIICDIAGVTLANQSYLKEWKHGSMKDSLTGLYNRRYFSYMVVKHVEKSVLKGFPISICMFDIDHFKNYNDTNGHQKGDILLRELSDLISRLTRKDSVLARYGGEEFIVMLPNIPKEEALRYAERVREEIERYPFLHSDVQPLGHVSISGGVATFPDDASSIEKVIEIADRALYRAKAEGRNRVIKHEAPKKLNLNFRNYPEIS